VCPAKYQKVVFDEEIDKELGDICIEISCRYEIEFIKSDPDHYNYFTIGA